MEYHSLLAQHFMETRQIDAMTNLRVEKVNEDTWSVQQSLDEPPHPSLSTRLQFQLHDATQILGLQSFHPLVRDQPEDDPNYHGSNPPNHGVVFQDCVSKAGEPHQVLEGPVTGQTVQELEAQSSSNEELSVVKVMRSIKRSTTLKGATVKKYQERTPRTLSPRGSTTCG
jgi:hypothetical protein